MQKFWRSVSSRHSFLAISFPVKASIKINPSDVSVVFIPSWEAHRVVALTLLLEPSLGRPLWEVESPAKTWSTSAATPINLLALDLSRERTFICFLMMVRAPSINKEGTMRACIKDYLSVETDAVSALRDIFQVKHSWSRLDYILNFSLNISFPWCIWQTLWLEDHLWWSTPWSV